MVEYLLFFKLEVFQVVKHTGSDQLLLITRLMQGSMQTSSHFSSNPAAAGSFFTLLLLGLKLGDCLRENGHCTGTFGASLLYDRIYRYVNPFQECRCSSLLLQQFLGLNLFFLSRNCSGL
jgi:hypothetical protein